MAAYPSLRPSMAANLRRVRAVALSCVAFTVLAVLAPAAHARDDDGWRGPSRSVLYLPALDVEAGGGYADGGGRWGWLGRLSAGLHRMTALGVLTTGPEAARETGRYVLGWNVEWVHLASGLGLDAAAMRDLSAERWGYRGAVAASYLRVGAAFYEDGVRVYTLSFRVPLALLAAWRLGYL